MQPSICALILKTVLVILTVYNTAVYIQNHLKPKLQESILPSAVQ